MKHISLDRNGENLRGGKASVNPQPACTNLFYRDELRLARIRSKTGKPRCRALPTKRW
jgi:hypothetical protein